MKRILLTASIMPFFLTALLIGQENWPRWRGPLQNGISSAKGLPLTWSAEENIRWKTDLPSWSAATPIVWQDRVFVISPSKAAGDAVSEPGADEPSRERRRRRAVRNPGGNALHLYCLSMTDGTVRWTVLLDEENQLHRKQNDASPSPVTDGEMVWVVTGSGKVTALDMKGTVIWKRDLQSEYGSFGLSWGYASSPLLEDGDLFIEVLHGTNTDDPSYIVCYEAKTGKEKWRVGRETDAREESPDAYTTPVMIRLRQGPQLIISGGDYVTGHDPASGSEIWRAAGLNPLKRGNYRVVGTPVYSNGILFVPTRRKPLLAFNMGGSGDISESHLRWKYADSGTADVPSPLCDGSYLYVVEDRGMVTCLKAGDGSVVWGPERTAEGIVSASPVLADGRIYIVNESGVTSVVASGAAFKHLATNELDGSYTLASPAVAGTGLLIRTEKALYCISK